MRIDVEYSSQIRSALGTQSEQIELDDNGTLALLIQTIVSIHGESAHQVLCDENGSLNKWILADRSGKLLRDPTTPLADGDLVRLMSPISGG